MRSISLLILTTLFISCGSKVQMGYDYTPVLLHLDKREQHDSIGFNLASEIPKLLYGKILSNDIALWESPDKKIRISKDVFLQMERSAKNPFVESNNFFIYEVWRIYKRNFSFGVIGFSFAGESRDGRKLNYGFIDAIDVISLMKDRTIPSNVNGSGYLSYWDAIHSMRFDFNLVQFGKEDFKQDPMKSFELRDQAVKNPKVKRELYQILQEKQIIYRIIPPDINTNPNNQAVYKVLETFVNDNKQTILNAGGAEHFSHIANIPWKIDNIIVSERWSKFNDLPFQELEHLQLFIAGKPIYLGKRELDEMGVKINLQGPEEYFSGKEFDFVIQRINSEEVKPTLSESYYRALMNNDWNNIK